MNLTIYAKKHHNTAGNDFYVYLTKLKTKDGGEIFARVRFTKDCSDIKPEECPKNIIVNKAEATLTQSTYKPQGSQEEARAHVLWVRKWAEGDPFIDTSLDDIVD